MSLASDKFQFIFVRVPRTGSATYYHYLRGCFDPYLIDVGSQHASAVELRGLWGEKWDQYQTFGFIRNPWDWLVSLFYSGVSATPGPAEAWQGNKTSDILCRTNMDFETFVRQRKTTPMDWLIDGKHIIVDEILRFEDFKSRWKVRVSSARGRPPYKSWYTPDLARYVGETFPLDIEIGKYVF